MKIEFTLDEQTAAFVDTLAEPETFLQQFFLEILSDYEGECQDPIRLVLLRHSPRHEALFQAKVEEATARLEVTRGLMRVSLRLNKE